MNINAKISLLGYIFAVLVTILLPVYHSNFQLFTICEIISVISFVLIYTLLDLKSYFKVRECLLNFYHAIGLGFLMGINLLLSYYSHSGQLQSHIWPFSAFLCVLSFFHWSEYMVTALYNERSLSINVYMILHSSEYLTAMAVSCIEYWIGVIIVQRFNLDHVPDYFKYFGLFACIFSDLFRKYAMKTAATNFNHQVEFSSRDDHILVDTGLYSYFRHPAYVGWFYWSVSTQILLMNPFCIILFPIASFYFFKERIRFEERALISFFGEKYIDYQNRVPTGIPFVKGCKP